MLAMHDHALYGMLMTLLQRACVLGRWGALCVIPHSGGRLAQGQSTHLTCYWFSCIPCTYSTGVMPRSICPPPLPSKEQGEEGSCLINHIDILPVSLKI